MTKTQQKTKLIPELRFPEFSGEWEINKLREVADFWNGKGHEKNICKNGDYIVVNSKFISTGGRVKKYTNEQKSPLKEDDIAIVMSDIPKGRALAKCFLVDRDNKYTLNQRIGGIRSQEIAARFLFMSLDRNKYYLKFDNKVSQTNLKKKEVLNCPIKFPTLPEQQKIASFLTEVDNLIDNFKQQKEKLEKYKKGMMQKIFSQEIRFKDENGKDFEDWEEKRLGDLINKESSSRSANSLDDNIGKFKIYGADGVYKNVDFYDHKNSYIGIVKDGAGVGRLLLCDAQSSIIGTLDALKSKGFNINFLFYYFKMIPFRKYVVGSTIPHIYFKDYKKHILYVPTTKEQQKIAKFLTSLDNLISIKQKQISKAEIWKKGLMQKMFV